MLRAEPPRRALHRTARDTWFDHAVLAVVFGLLLSGFHTVIRGSDWWITTVLVAILTGLTCAILRAIGMRWVAPIALVIELLALAWIFAPQTLLVVLPTFDTAHALGSLVAKAQDIIIEEQAPVAAAKPVVFLIASSFGLLVIVADALLERLGSAQALGVLFLAVFATPAMISGTTPPVWLFLTVAALWLVILRTRTGHGMSIGWHTTVPALVVAAAALVASVGFPVVSPDISAVAASWGKPPPTVFGRGINPMLELGQNLRRNNPVTALTYTTSMDNPPYLKVATLRDFTGKTWRPATTGRPDRFEGGIGIDDGIKTSPASTTIQVKQLRSTMLPVPYPALDVTGLKGHWRWERVGMTLRSDDDDSRGESYSVSSLMIEPTGEQMRDLRTVVGPTLRPYVELPEKMPRIIADTAREVTADARNDYDEALALQAFLRSGDFRYSETAPVADGYDGNGVDVIAKFLQKRSGYCVHFSSAMAVMARTIGIPARIAVGYAPGNAMSMQRGKNLYEVTSDDLHAWTELYFNGVGWVAFEPTPGVGTATAFSEPFEPSTPSDSGELPESVRPDSLNATEGLDAGVTSTPTPTQTAPRTAFVTIAALLLLVAAPALVRWVRRRWRLRRGIESPDPLWRELEDTARDFGITASPADTPRGFAGRLARSPGVDGQALDRLLCRVETVRFARNGAAEGHGVADLWAVIESLRRGASRRDRLRARLLPRSLAGRGVYVAGTQPEGTATLAT